MINKDKVAAATCILMEALHLNQEDPGFIDTPDRVARFWSEFVDREPPEIKVFPSSSTDLVRLDGYTTWGLCPHHLLPVRYTISVSYIPNGKVFGISKLPRIVNYVLRALPLQEDLPKMVVNYLHSCLNVKEARCQVTGLHLCMVMRGVRAGDCQLTTFAELKREDYTCQISK